jgi:membrane protein
LLKRNSQSFRANTSTGTVARELEQTPMRLRTSLLLLKAAAVQWSADRAAAQGAALAYYTLFSIAPLLVIAIAIAGLVFGKEAARGEVTAQLTEALGKETAEAIQGLLQEVNKPQTGGWAAAAGIATLLVGALGVFLHLRGALCTIWRLEPPGGGGILAIVFDYLLAIIMVLCCGVLLLASLAATSVLAYLSQEFKRQLPWAQWPWQAVEFLTSVALFTVLVALLYYLLSGRRIPWRLTWYGAAITSLLLTVGKTLIGWYLGTTGTASAYGAAGSLVVFLIWVYYSAQILFFGAELIQARRLAEVRVSDPPGPYRASP